MENNTREEILQLEVNSNYLSLSLMPNLGVSQYLLEYHIMFKIDWNKIQKNR